jgi:hypothetical protein
VPRGKDVGEEEFEFDQIAYIYASLNLGRAGVPMLALDPEYDQSGNVD